MLAEQVPPQVVFLLAFLGQLGFQGCAAGGQGFGRSAMLCLPMAFTSTLGLPCAVLRQGVEKGRARRPSSLGLGILGASRLVQRLLGQAHALDLGRPGRQGPAMT